MPVDVTMPRLSDTMEAGTVVRWHVKEGDPVSSGSVVADIETDKATMEMQVYDDGRIARILVPEGQSVRVGTKIAEIAVEDDASGAGAREPMAPGAAAGSSGAAAVPPPVSQPRPPGPGDRAVDGDGAQGTGPRVSPVARRMAEQLGVDLGQVRGSGPAGRIIKRDIEAAAEMRGSTAAGRTGTQGPRDAGPSLPAPLASPIVPRSDVAAVPVASSLERAGLQSAEVGLSSMRQTIARRLVESVTTIPHYQVSMSFDMDALVALRTTLNEELAQAKIKLSVNDFIVRACALSMARHPFVNASWGGDRIVVHQTVNVGVAVALDEEKGGGLLVATIRDADRKSLRQISAETRQLSEKARTRGLTLEEMSDSTFTISNLGMFGVDHFTAIINPPNSAILACGAAAQRPVVRSGALVVGWEMTVTLSSDHRVIDGAMAARFLQTLKQLVEHPTLLLV